MERETFNGEAGGKEEGRELKTMQSTKVVRRVMRVDDHNLSSEYMNTNIQDKNQRGRKQQDKEGQGSSVFVWGKG